MHRNVYIASILAVTLYANHVLILYYHVLLSVAGETISNVYTSCIYVWSTYSFELSMSGNQQEIPDEILFRIIFMHYNNYYNTLRIDLNLGHFTGPKASFPPYFRIQVFHAPYRHKYTVLPAVKAYRIAGNSMPINILFYLQ